MLYKLIQLVFGNFVSSGLVCLFDPLKWPSRPKSLSTPGKGFQPCFRGSNMGTFMTC